METKRLVIENGCRQIPAVVWGKPQNKLLLAVHGVASNKEDRVIQIAAQVGERKGFCTLSFDLPEHGERIGQTDYGCNPWNALSDFLAVYKHAKTLAANISIFACSLGAYITMLAADVISPQELLMLSPVVSMEHVIEGMMAFSGVTPERLEAEKVIPVPGGSPLDWEYYSYVKEHPIRLGAKWRDEISLAILYGEHDNVASFEDVSKFASSISGDLTVLPGGEHYFHTPEHLQALEEWLNNCLSPVNVPYWLNKLTAKDSAAGCGAMEFLLKESKRCNSCYPYFHDFSELLRHRSSFVRNRGLALIAANAVWDADGKIDSVLHDVFRCLSDESAITVRQCIKALREIGRVKSTLAPSICAHLENADLTGYKDSMRPLIQRDIETGLKELKAGIA